MLAARLRRGGGPSRWEFPGGKVEPGETAVQALRREIHEELAMEIEVGDVIAETLVPGTVEPMRLRLYRARWSSGGPALVDHDEIGWFDAPTLRRLDWHAADVELLQALLEGGLTTD